MELRVRFVEKPLSERKMSGTTAAIQSDTSIRKASMSDAGLAMMASIVGKRIPKYVKDHIGCALLDTMSGNFDDDGETEGDVFASVYGEILGPLFTCLERDGDFLIIRLMPSRQARNQGKRADLLLVEQSRGSVMLQECKGHCSDYYSVADDEDSFDICQQMRDLRNAAKREQMIWPSPDQLGPRRVRITGRSSHVVLPFPQAERSVVVTAVPDGRTAAPSFSPNPPAHENCEESCKTCLFDGGPTLVTVLSTERIEDDTCVGPDGMTFLNWYKACERSIWGRAHGSFGRAFSFLLGTWRRLETSTETQVASVPLLSGLIEQAVDRKLFVDFRPIWGACEEIRPPKELMMALRTLHNIQGDMPHPAVREGSASQLGQMLVGMKDEGPDIERVVGNWQFSVGRENVSQEGRGTSVEVCVAKPFSGTLEIIVVPQGADQSPSDLRWGLSEILAGGRMPPEFVYEAFVEEEVRWEYAERGESRGYHLGHTLQGPWFPFWPWIYDRRMLEEMRHCCRACDEMAHMLMHWEKHQPHWPEPFFIHHHFRHRLHRYPWDQLYGYDFHPLAFVTNDSKAMLRIPYWGE